jgi:hypothetical protein
MMVSLEDLVFESWLPISESLVFKGIERSHQPRSTIRFSIDREMKHWRTCSISRLFANQIYDLWHRILSGLDTYLKIERSLP